jgi:glyoxylase-like metal-dependent hydrolase (beta-lactamase superfamily II)
MKRRAIVLVACILSTLIVKSQPAGSWFVVKEVAKDVWQINDKGANIYLIIGRDSALVVDTGIGAANLVGQIRKLTDKPLIVLNTHGHGDHAGANYQFEKVYVQQADLDDAATTSTPERMKAVLANMPEEQKPSGDDQFKGKPFNTKLIPVIEGDFFNLGDRWLKVIETPGHTPGGICLLDIGNKLLFSGDTNNGLVWLWMKDALPLSKFLLTLEKQVQKIDEFTTIFPGHGDPLPADLIKDQVACVKAILDGTCQCKPYESFAGDAQVCTVGRASVAFSPENL